MAFVSGGLPDFSVDLDVVVEKAEEGDNAGDDQLLPDVAENLKQGWNRWLVVMLDGLVWI